MVRPANRGTMSMGMSQATCQFVLDDLTLERGAGESLQEQILMFLRRSIRCGRLPPGSRMPSSRSMATANGISRTTVVEVYAKLQSEGYIVARPRAGYFVADTQPSAYQDAPAPQSTKTHSPAGAGTGRGATDRARTRPSAGRTTAYQDLPLAPGIPAVDRFPWRQWTRLSAQVLRRHASRAFAFADPRGELPLREAVADYLTAFRGMPCNAGQVLIANGSQSLVEMLIRATGRPGDRVWFEEPGDPNSRAVLNGLGLQPVPVPVDRHGIDVSQGMRIAPDARFALVASSHHYPLAVTMSMQRRRALLEFGATAGAWIIENEIDCDFRFGPQAREPLYSLDGASRVIYLGSFNKAVAPGLRVGYAVVPEELAARLTPTSSPVGVHQQLLLAKFWAAGHLATHLRELREIHTERRELLLRALRERAAGMLSIDGPPEAGLRIAARLPDGMDDRPVVAAALQAGIGLGRPISSCYCGTRRRNGITLGFASTVRKDIVPAVDRLVGVVSRYVSAV